MYLMYKDKVIGTVPDTCRCISEAFETLGINIMSARACKIAYARGTPGFYSNVDGYYLDLPNVRLVRSIKV